jgi:arylsulfatase
MRWPGKIKAGTVLNGICSHQDMLPTLPRRRAIPMSARSCWMVTRRQQDLQGPHRRINLLVSHGRGRQSPRAFLLRQRRRRHHGGPEGDYKLVFRSSGRCRPGLAADVPLRLPLIFNLRRDPFERAQHNSNVYYDWLINHASALRSQALVAAQIDNFVKYPPRQKAASFSLDAVMRQLGPAIKAEKAKEAAAAAKESREPALTR